MRPQVRSNRARFRRSPSRCQMFWQGILILATLALAYAADASPACYDLFAPLHAPLRPGNSVTLRYSFPEASPQSLLRPEVRSEILSSVTRTAHSLMEKNSELRRELATLEGKTSRVQVARRSEINGALRLNRASIERLSKINEMATHPARPLRADELSILRAETFEQTIVLKSRADSKQLDQRLSALDGHLAAVENVKLPPGRIKRVFRWMMNHKLVTLVLASAALSGGNYGYDLYVKHEAARNAPVVMSIYQGPTAGDLQSARDNPNEAIGN